MPIKEQEVSILQMWRLMRKGILLEFQVFLNQIGNKKQIYRTKVCYRKGLYVCYHYRPFPFLLTEKGRIISQQAAANFQNKLSIDKG